jgi:tRNA A-37 threonylcarbamoyl transferase component Bud32
MGREDLLPQTPAGPGLDTFAGRYRLERSLGSGGMGEVFGATDTVLDRRVALKRLSSTLAEDDAARSRFFREARALARINDPNVVGVFDAGEQDGTPFLVMELIEGTTLRDELRASGRLAPERARRIGAGVAAGLAAAHAHGVIHRDVKPSNIFLTTDGQPKVGDFGIARIERGDATLTLTGQAFGSAPYMAPEQAMGGRTDARADLYSLGCVLYEMLAGRRPFRGNDAVALAYQHLHTEPVHLDAGGRVEPRLASLVASLLQKDPADRPKSAEDVREALTEVPVTTTAIVPLPAVERDHTAVIPRRAETLAGRRKRPWWLFAGAGAVILLASLALASAFRNGGTAAGTGTSPPAQTAPSRTTSPSTAPSALVPSTPEELGAAIVTLAHDLAASAPSEKHLADDMEHTVSDVLDHQDEPSEGVDKLEELKDKIAEELDHAKISTDEAAQLTQAIDRLERSLTNANGGGD